MTNEATAGHVPAAYEFRISRTDATGAARGGRGTRFLDITLAMIGLALALPILLLIALSVKLQDGGPVLFAQARIGRGGRTFRCYKVRTMVVDAQARLDAVLASDPAARREWERDHKLRNDPRITPLGRLLRETSLDELPQLLNVLKGDMSVVGPRPIVHGEVEKYGRFFRHYCAVRPGITGIWQVSGRNDVDYRRRVAMDVVYARRQSFWLNCAIMAATVPAVLQRRGSY